MNYEGWDQDYTENEDLYLSVFDKAIQTNNDKNVEFLEKKISTYVGRKHGIAINSETNK